MQRFYDVITDQFGNPANGVLVTVYDAATGTPSTLYRDSDNSLTATNVISNPFTTNASGIVAFAVANGQYTITYSGSSITPRTFTWLTMSDGATSSVPWGSITGTLASQTDLNTALGLKAPAANPTFTGSATFSFLTNTRVPFAGAAGLLSDNANLTYTVGTGLKVADATVSSSSTTGALIVTGGVGVGGAVYLADRLTVNASGATSKPLDIGGLSGTQADIRMFSAAGSARFVRFYTGGNLRWGLGANGAAETGSDAGSIFQLWAANDGGTTIDYPLNITRAAGGTISMGQTSRPVSIASTANFAEWIHGSASELLTLSTAGLTTNTSANLLPANAIIEAVVCRITTAITTTTNWAVGDATISNRFSSANATLAAGTTSVGLNHVDLTGTSGPKQTSAAPVRITCTGSNPGAGVVRITVFYRQFVAPTS